MVRHHSPMYGRVVFAITLTVIAAAGWGLYQLGLYNAGFNRHDADEKQMQLEQHVADLQLEKANLRDQVALASRSQQVDKQAYQQVNDNLKSLQQEILELREEVSFYRGIVSPMESSAGIRINRFKVEQTGAENIFHYNMVLTQVLKNDRSVRGKVKLFINGIQNGKPKKLKFKQVSGAKSAYLEFKFRYFQKFEGDIVLPKDFSPLQVLVEVNPHKRKKINSTYQWPKDFSETEKTEAEES